jgi:integrase/recombinase XerD
MEQTRLVPLFELCDSPGVPARPAVVRPVVSIEGRLGQLVEAWLGEYPASTAASYLRDLERFASWCGSEGLDPLAIRRAELARYLLALGSSGLSPSTAARRASAISSFYCYLASTGEISCSPAQGLRRPRRQRRPPLGFGPGELARMLRAAEKEGRSTWCLVLLLGAMGLRVSEACALAVGDLSAGPGLVRIRVRRKGGVRETLEVPEPIADGLKGLARGRLESAPLIASASGRWLSRRQAHRIVARLGERAGIPRPVHPHLLRHSFVSLALVAGAPLVAVSAAAGHRDRATTLGYAEALAAGGSRSVAEAVLGSVVGVPLEDGAFFDGSERAEVVGSEPASASWS